ncbi:RNA polymerase sigma factor [Actinophytocola gossypii]|uniref:Sigma-70 family RNA polymerase sigma factor n=1 Tax=Actinophytocola gossypii TaxID=2812003 RepID=A0ABT2JCX3_9PSEU|nr:sigma-70 family RNA polymerase sigma factor [Actinophytocola gossypii]MCT2585728.1 sigma-70 family RNA polymerase sigma factor [Actinophytocola gossypii]
MTTTSNTIHGDNDWSDLLDRHTPVVWLVARSHRLDHADAADAVQNTWTALAEHLPRINSPDRLRSWLVTTARRESLRIRSRRDRDQDLPASCPEPCVSVRDRQVWLAFGALSDRCRLLLALHAHAPELSHAQLAAALEMATGSVGPTRTRCLDHLRRLLPAE